MSSTLPLYIPAESYGEAIGILAREGIHPIGKKEIPPEIVRKAAKKAKSTVIQEHHDKEAERILIAASYPEILAELENAQIGMILWRHNYEEIKRELGR